MDVFEVEDTTFNSRSHFHRYLSEHHAELIDGNLYICAGLTEYPYEKFLDAIQAEGWEVSETFGEAILIETAYGTGAAQAYLLFDENTGLFFLYTDQRKNKEIDDAVLKLLKQTDGVHYLYIGPRIIRNLCNEIQQSRDSSRVTMFIAKRTPGTEIGAKRRPDTSRTINYYGNDGMEALGEVERDYGVLPNTVEIQIPAEIRFRVNKEGVFALKSGRLRALFEYMNSCISQTLAMKQEYDETDFKVLEVGNGYEIPESKPATIELSKHITTDSLYQVRQTLRDSDYTMLDVYLDESATVLSAKVFDSAENLFFNLEVSPNKMRIFPRENSQMSVFLRFFEFVQAEIDDRASPKQGVEAVISGEK
jgi:hypothetical protein